MGCVARRRARQTGRRHWAAGVDLDGQHRHQNGSAMRRETARRESGRRALVPLAAPRNLEPEELIMSKPRKSVLFSTLCQRALVRSVAIGRALLCAVVLLVGI